MILKKFRSAWITQRESVIHLILYLMLGIDVASITILEVEDPDHYVSIGFSAISIFLKLAYLGLIKKFTDFLLCNFGCLMIAQLFGYLIIFKLDFRKQLHNVEGLLVVYVFSIFAIFYFQNQQRFAVALFTFLNVTYCILLSAEFENLTFRIILLASVINIIILFIWFNLRNMEESAYISKAQSDNLLQVISVPILVFKSSELINFNQAICHLLNDKTSEEESFPKNENIAQALKAIEVTSCSNINLFLNNDPTAINCTTSLYDLIINICKEEQNQTIKNMKTIYIDVVIVDLQTRKTSNKNLQIDIIQNTLDGQNDSIIFCLIDNTTLIQKRIKENILNQNQAFQQISNHELNNPLNGQMAVLETLKNEKMNPENLNYVEIALQSTIYFKNTLQNMSDYTKISSSKLIIKIRRVNLIYILNKCIKQFEYFANNKNILIKFDYNMNDVLIFSDEQKINQVIYSLMYHIFKLSAQSEIIELGIILENGQVFLFIQNRKLVLDEVAVEKMFELNMLEYNNLDQQYGGINLYMCQKINNLLNGHSKCSSSQKDGTIFKILFHDFQQNMNELKGSDKKSQISKAISNISYNISMKEIEIQNNDQNLNNEYYLDIDEKNDAEIINRADLKEEIYDFGNKQECQSCALILIVDDILFNVVALKAVLKNFKMKLDTAFDGLEGLQKIKDSFNRTCNCGPYKLVVTDINMPKMNGVEMIKNSLHIENISMNFVVLSGGSQDTYYYQLSELGIEFILQKPIMMDQVNTIMNRFFKIQIEK